MSKRKKIIALLISFPFICGLCMFISATLGISEPYLYPIPLRILPVIPNSVSYRCGSGEFLEFTRDYKVSLPRETVKKYYKEQMSFYCSDIEGIHINLDTDFYFSMSCNLRYQFAYMNFNYAVSKPTNALYSVMIFSSSNNTTQVEESQLVHVDIPGASFMCPE